MSPMLMNERFTGMTIGVEEIPPRAGWKRFREAGTPSYWVDGDEVTREEYERFIGCPSYSQGGPA